MSGLDYRDIVIEDFADEIAALHEHVEHLAERAVLAEVDRDAHRLVAQQAMHGMHDLQVQNCRLERRNRQLTDELRTIFAAEREASDVAA